MIFMAGVSLIAASAEYGQSSTWGVPLRLIGPVGSRWCWYLDGRYAACYPSHRSNLGSQRTRREKLPEMHMDIRCLV
ncbi:hypothetical protein AG1IA_06954 [Rhizoctonia solani AG-1 IA]|uniref:Uncharacterized protein n=1 Tax=Thanatephorus cucumeris (strain AG1-IA) TaxID=983506 RepID=L8WM34_THACA|nr:hypothetical protein AG1IA_06954 [Rhizoctonia solani AG-1 IA]